MALLLLVVIAALCGAAGRACLRAMRVEPESAEVRFAASGALGMGLLGYAILAVGLAGLLNRTAFIVLLALLAAAGVAGRRPMLADIRCMAAAWLPRSGRLDWLRLASGAVIVACLAGSLVSAFNLPDAMEWDSLSYHLAAPKQYLAAGRIVFLPTDHHSNFPFLTQMLYTLGLALQGPALAKLIHWWCFVLLLIAVAGLGDRAARPGAGAFAAALCALTPVALWEAGTAYIDIAQALMTTVAFALAADYATSRSDRIAGAAGLFAGLALGVKTLSLVPAALLGGWVLVSGRRPRAVLAYAACAVALGAPFYVKAWVQTGNPVYPFAYKLFGGRYWNADLAQRYSGEQTSFGLDARPARPGDDLVAARNPVHVPPAVGDRLRNLLLGPFALVSVPRLFSNYNSPGAESHLGMGLLALLGAALVYRPLGRLGGSALGIAACWFVAWSLSMQYVRYLIPLAPLVCVAGAAALLSPHCGRPGAMLAAAVLALQCAFTGVVFLPRLPGAVERAASAEADRRHVQRQVNCAASEQWINANTPAGAQVVLFEETRGFGLDRRYLWGNEGHSLYIPYSQFGDASAMVDWFLDHGVAVALVNLQFSPFFQDAASAERLRAAVRGGTEAELFLEAYRTAPRDGERWRFLLAEAVTAGRAEVAQDGSRYGCVVLRLLPGAKP